MGKTIWLENICKLYPRKTVLKDVSCSFKTGQFYALLGENGAGKSSLAAILAGEIPADMGRVINQDKQNQANIAVVHQRPLLADELSVRDNIILGQRGIINYKKIEAKLFPLFEKWDISLNPKIKVSSLDGSEKFYTALSAALYTKPDFLILDEPAAVLYKEQKTALFSRLKQSVNEGLGILLITHNIDEALEYADTLLILHKGNLNAVIKRGETDFTKQFIKGLMFYGIRSTEKSVKKEVYFAPPQNQAPSKNTDSSLQDESAAAKNIETEPLILDLQKLSFMPPQGAALFDVSFSVQRKKITCIYGQRESGLETLENLITGMTAPSASYTGSIFFMNNKIRAKKLSPAFLRLHNAGIVPFNPAFRGSNPALTIEELLTAPLSRRNAIPKAAFSAYAKNLITRAQVDIGINEPAANLSGGMLQRLLFARETAEKKDLLILCEPAYGMDTLAAESLAQKIRSLADEGAAVLVLSSGSESLKSIANFAYTMIGGRIHAA